MDTDWEAEQLSTDTTEPFTFGQRVENIAASEDNPTKRGFYIGSAGSRLALYASPRGVHRTPNNNLRASFHKEVNAARSRNAVGTARDPQ